MRFFTIFSGAIKIEQHRYFVGKVNAGGGRPKTPHLNAEIDGLGHQELTFNGKTFFAIGRWAVVVERNLS